MLTSSPSMQKHDELPAVIRLAIIAADFPFPPEVALRLLNKGVPAERIADVIAGADYHVAQLRGER